MREKIEFIVASFGIPLFVVAILFVFILIFSFFPEQRSVEERKEILNYYSLNGITESIEISVTDLKLDLIAGVDGIYYSDELLPRKREDSLKIAKGDGWLDRLFLAQSDIIMGQRNYKELKLTGDELVLNGQMDAQRLVIDYAELNGQIRFKDLNWQEDKSLIIKRGTGQLKVYLPSEYKDNLLIDNMSDVMIDIKYD